MCSGMIRHHSCQSWWCTWRACIGRIIFSHLLTVGRFWGNGICAAAAALTYSSVLDRFSITVHDDSPAESSGEEPAQPDSGLNHRSARLRERIKELTEVCRATRALLAWVTVKAIELHSCHCWSCSLCVSAAAECIQAVCVSLTLHTVASKALSTCPSCCSMQPWCIAHSPPSMHTKLCCAARSCRVHVLWSAVCAVTDSPSLDVQRVGESSGLKDLAKKIGIQMSDSRSISPNALSQILQGVFMHMVVKAVGQNSSPEKESGAMALKSLNGVMLPPLTISPSYS